MNIITHFIAGWVFSAYTAEDRKSRILITAASAAPDLDGLGIIPELLSKNSAAPVYAWTEYHHVFCHNIAAAVLMSAAAYAIAKNSKTAFFCFISFHVHLLFDILGGAAGPDERWPVYYLYPFSRSFALDWNGQWEINAWPNVVFTAGLLALCVLIAARKKISPLEIVSAKADAVFCETAGKWTGQM